MTWGDLQSVRQHPPLNGLADARLPAESRHRLDDVVRAQRFEARQELVIGVEARRLAKIVERIARRVHK